MPIWALSPLNYLVNARSGMQQHLNNLSVIAGCTTADGCETRSVVLAQCDAGGWH